MEDTTLLEVPFDEKDDAKALGAKWNPSLKKWYIPKGIDVNKFEQWLPEAPAEPDITLTAPIYLLKSWTNCWRCNSSTDVFCLASEHLIDHYEDDMELSMFLQFSNLAYAPNSLQGLLKSHAPTYYPDYTKQSNSTYYVNHCKCGAKLGDFYLHNEPEGAFFPINENQAKEVTMYELSDIDEVKINASYGTQDMEFILHYATRQTL